MAKHTNPRIAALGDLHVRETSRGSYTQLFKRISDEADFLVLCGDLTNLGLPIEAEILAEELLACTIPVVGVLGNHDIESGHEEQVKSILTHAKMYVLDTEPFEINGVGFAGTKGFCGGFDNHMLSPFGEQAIKAFVQEAVSESLKLEHALSSLRTEKKVVALHYSPIKNTVVGEPESIFPFLGSSRLAEPIDHFNASIVFHGHAHRGSPQGTTAGGVPVYNASYPVMQKASPDRPYALVTL